MSVARLCVAHTIVKREKREGTRDANKIAATDWRGETSESLQQMKFAPTYGTLVSQQVPAL